jgi:hypothetical protein
MKPDRRRASFERSARARLRITFFRNAIIGFRGRVRCLTRAQGLTGRSRRSEGAPWVLAVRLGAAMLACMANPMACDMAAAEMTREPTAVIQGLDKIAARVSRFEAPVGQAVHFGKLLVTVRDCERSAPEDRPENAAFIEVAEERPGEARERLFAGWMFSSSPALSALEHPVYDVTLLECKGAVPPAPATAAASTDKPAGKSRTKAAR